MRKKKNGLLPVTGQVCEAEGSAGGGGIPLFFLLRTRGLWKHTLCAAASRPKDLLTSAVGKQPYPSQAERQVCLVGMGEGAF